MGGDGGGPLDLAAGPPLRPTWARLQTDGVSPPAGTSPSRPAQFFLPCLWGWEMVLSPTLTPAQMPPSPSPTGGKGREGGGRAPLGTAVAQSISPKPRTFLLPKRKKKKKNPSGHFSSLPHWDSRDWICGVSREGGSGLEHSQARVVELPVRPSARPTAGFSPLPLPSKQTTRGGLPLTSGPWAGAWGARGWGGGAVQP